MAKVKLINGWTVDSLKEAIRTRNDGHKATVAVNSTTCMYITDDGSNSCFIGCLIPADRLSPDMDGTVYVLLAEYPEFRKFMFTNDENALYRFQSVHDDYKVVGGIDYDIRELAYAWIDKNCEDNEA